MTGHDELLELLRAEKSVQPPAAAVDGGWQRLSRDLAANVPPMAIASSALKPGLWLVPKWILAGLVLGFAGAGISSALTPSAVAVSVPARAVRVGSASSSVPARASNVQVELEPTTAPPAINVRAEPSLPRVGAAASASPSTTFDAELKLITRSKVELDARRFAAARAALDEHAAQFPRGVFDTERDALRVLVSCTQGPTNALLAKRFEQQHPGSPLADRLERACASASAQAERAPAPKAVVDFSKLPNEEPALGERMAEPRTGEQP